MCTKRDARARRTRGVFVSMISVNSAADASTPSHPSRNTTATQEGPSRTIASTLFALHAEHSCARATTPVPYTDTNRKAFADEEAP